MGVDGFVWFFGIVEDRQDPLGYGRVRVRAFGWHDDSLTAIPTDHLPWAQVVQPGTDRNFATPREDDFVLGFFADGRNAQQPIILGVMNGLFATPNDPGKGYNDQRTAAILQNSPRFIQSAQYKTDGSGITLSSPSTATRHPTVDELNQPTVTGVARYENLANTVVQQRKNNLDKDVVTAGGVQWSEPSPAYNPLYPYNQVYASESGHVIEYDDTPGNERIALQHRSGSFIEWYPTGTVVEKVTKSRYSVVMGEDHLHVMGRVMITVGSDALIRVVGDCNLQVESDLNAKVAGDANFSVGGGFNVKAGSVNIESDGDASVLADTLHLTTDSDIDVKSGGDFNAQGSTVNLKADELLMGGGSYASVVGGTVQLAGYVTVEEGGTAPSGAGSGSAAGLPAAPSAGSPTTGRPSLEAVPVPFPENFAQLDPETGTAYVHSLFLDNGVDPGANAAAVNAAVTSANVGSCNFEADKHTFLDDESSWTIDDAGLTLIKGFEGFAKVTSPDTCAAYPDPATKAEPITIGYGSTAVAIDQPVTLGMIISRTQATAFLNYAINKKFMPALRQAVTVPLTQNMIDACLSLMYNIGQTNFSNSTLVKKLNQQDYCAAANQFLVWNKAAGVVQPGLTRRRTSERSTFLS